MWSPRTASSCARYGTHAIPSATTLLHDADAVCIISVRVLYGTGTDVWNNPLKSEILHGNIPEGGRWSEIQISTSTIYEYVHKYEAGRLYGRLEVLCAANVPYSYSYSNQEG